MSQVIRSRLNVVIVLSGFAVISMCTFVKADRRFEFFSFLNNCQLEQLWPSVLYMYVCARLGVRE